MKTRAFIIACCLAVVAATVLVTLPSRGHAAAVAQRAVAYAPGCPKVDAKVFEAEAFVRFIDEVRPAQVFDQSLVPADDTTCYKEHFESAHLKITRPCDKSSYPLNIGTPDFRWDDETDNLWMVVVKAPGWQQPLKVVTAAKQWRPDVETWDSIKKSGTGEWVTFEVRGCRVKDGNRVDGAVYSDSVSFKISKYPADPMLVFRLVPPLFHTYKTPDMYYQNIATLEQGLFYPSGGTHCTNCHSFPVSPDVSKDDFNLAIAVRRRKNADRMSMLGIYNLASHKGKAINAGSFFMSWNPDGTKLVACVGADTFQKPLVTLETQDFIVRQADLYIFDPVTGKETPLPGAISKPLMESFPAWSTDGRTILFSRAEEIGDIWRPLRYEILQVPYNDGKGGEATPLPGASNNGLSNYFPRFSPDGKWMVWTKSEWGSLVRPTSDLWIMSAGDWSDPRKLECNVDFAMDSHHSWSSNSRWLVFATKRDDGIFARMYMTEIDDSGHASPPIEVPTPAGRETFCYNVPEFMRYEYSIDSHDIMMQTSELPKK